MRIGIFGGSFNPPHKAHMQLCQYAMKHAFLDQILLIPTGDNPLKMGDDRIDRRHRLNMVRLAAERMEHYTVSDIEINREGRSFTIDTLRQLKQVSDDDFYFISGSDILYQLHQWKEFDQLAELTTFICVPRKGVDNSQILQKAEQVYHHFNASIILLESDQPEEISSSEVRQRVQAGEPYQQMLDQKIYEYIQNNNLYR